MSNEWFTKKIIIQTEATIHSLMEEILSTTSREEDELFELIKIIDRRIGSVDFTKKIYEWSKQELLKEGELSETDLVDMSPEFISSIVKLINRSMGKQVILEIDEHEDDEHEDDGPPF